MFGKIPPGYFKPVPDSLRESLREGVDVFLPEGTWAENVKGRLGYKDERWVAEDLTFKVYGGNVVLNGTMDLGSKSPAFHVGLKADHVGLSQFTSRRGQDNVLDGDLLLEAEWDGTLQPGPPEQAALQGRGKWKMTGGNFRTFSVLGAIGKIQEFSDLDFLISDSTPFDEFAGTFVFEGGRFKTLDAGLLSPELWADIDGDASVDGKINSRLEVYLSTDLSGRVLAPHLGAGAVGPNQRFGPVPLLLAGPLTAPEIKPDTTELAKLLGDLEKKKTQRFLPTFPSGDLFLSRREKD